MKFLPHFFRLALLIVGLVACICAESACSRRSDPMPPGLRETINTWNTEAAEKTVDDLLPRYRVGTEDEVKLANAFAVQTISAARLAKAIRAKWGQAAETQAMHLCYIDTPEDDSAATVTVRGDHATLTFAGLQLAPMYLIKTKGVWQFDMGQYVGGYGGRLKTIIKYCDRSSEAFDKLTAAINSGEIASAKDAISALKTAVAAVIAQP